MALGWQTLEAKKADKPLEQGGALEQVGARMKRVMGLTPELSRPAGRTFQVAPRPRSGLGLNELLGLCSCSELRSAHA